MPPITELTRIEPVYLDRLEKQGVFTTGILLEVSETPTRRQYLADHVGATINEVGTWRDEGLMLNLASFGPDEHQLMIQAGIEGLRDILGAGSRRVPRASPTGRRRARRSNRRTTCGSRAGGTRPGRSRTSRSDARRCRRSRPATAPAPDRMTR